MNVDEKKDVPGRLHKKAQQKIKVFLKDRTFIIRERSKLNDDTHLHWLKENDRKIKNRFLRQELFVLKNQFVEE